MENRNLINFYNLPNQIDVVPKETYPLHFETNSNQTNYPLQSHNGNNLGTTFGVRSLFLTVYSGIVWKKCSKYIYFGNFGGIENA